MARRHYGFDEAKIADFLKEGRGQGQGAAYKPWLMIRDVPSQGRSHRPHGRKTGRVHQFLSDIEYRAFLLFEWADPVVDIREQFPLDREATQRIAKSMGVHHPCDVKSRVPLVMTTDLVVDVVRDGRKTTIARAVKPAQQLDKRRVIEKLEIERRYWAEKGTDWGLVTELDISSVAADNVEWVRAYAAVDDMTQPYPGYLADKAAILVRDIPTRSYLSLREFAAEMDLRLEMETGTALALVRHLLAQKAVICAVDEPWDENLPLSHFCLNVAAAKRARA